MNEYLENRIREILKHNKIKPELWNIRTLMAMESAYRQGYMDAMQKVSTETDPVTSCQNSCDKVSHGRHIEYDKLSHRSCWNCLHCEMSEEDFGMFCHHDDIRSNKELPISECSLWEANNGSVPR